MIEGPDTIHRDLEETAPVEISDPAVMDKHPLVSVEMLTYNHGPYIAQAIEGVLAQKADFPIELVIGEDCSTDRTREVVLEYQRKHPDVIRVVLWGKNVGARRNFLKLDALLRGRFVVFNEGDDYWCHQLKLQKQVDYLEAHPEVGLVHGRADEHDVVGGKHQLTPPRPDDYDDGDLFGRCLNGAYQICTATAFVRTDLYRTVRRDSPDAFDERFLMFDTQLWLELARLTRFKYMDETLATRNILPESATQSRDLRNVIRFRKSGLEMRKHYIRKYGVDAATEAQVRSSFAREFLGYAYTARDRELAEEAWAELRSSGARIGLKDHVRRAGVENSAVRAVIGVCEKLTNRQSRTQA